MCEIFDYTEPFEFYFDESVVARTNHKCSCCNCPIAKGEKYLKVSYKFDGEVKSEKMCDKCHQIKVEFDEDHDGGYSAPSSYFELINECINQRESFSSMLKWSRALKKISNQHKKEEEK